MSHQNRGLACSVVKCVKSVFPYAVPVLNAQLGPANSVYITLQSQLRHTLKWCDVLQIVSAMQQVRVELQQEGLFNLSMSSIGMINVSDGILLLFDVHPREGLKVETIADYLGWPMSSFNADTACFERFYQCHHRNSAKQAIAKDVKQFLFSFYSAEDSSQQRSDPSPSEPDARPIQEPSMLSYHEDTPVSDGQEDSTLSSESNPKLGGAPTHDRDQERDEEVSRIRPENDISMTVGEETPEFQAREALPQSDFSLI